MDRGCTEDGLTPSGPLNVEGGDSGLGRVKIGGGGLVSIPLGEDICDCPCSTSMHSARSSSSIWNIHSLDSFMKSETPDMTDLNSVRVPAREDMDSSTEPIRVFSLATEALNSSISICCLVRYVGFLSMNEERLVQIEKACRGADTLPFPFRSGMAASNAARDGQMALALRLAKHLSPSPANAVENIAFLPVSVHGVLALVAAGARGATLAQLLAFLGAPSAAELADFGHIVTHRVLADRWGLHDTSGELADAFRDLVEVESYESDSECDELVTR
ncbi:hypothetical protein PR202_ga22100 [Eleusine coracana subsp. coracana]|uniref:Serpin domain-containing protein n=1 Tax=Eleusine coracana subsp. coracana TaxID=191504 RepID=A0AAV5D2L2_ELECO|nr:hypothetical protein PR202_ga22100 [Eleusine coracana subsp. coracana]